MGEGDKKAESSGVLANALFSQGFKKMRDYHEKAAEISRRDGFKELADKHNKLAEIAIANATLLEPSPLLSEEENKKYIELLHKCYIINSNGMIIDNDDADISERLELLDLVNKANPPGTNK